MTDDALRELFQEALLDEPDRPVFPDEDIARGRAVRSRRRRTRLSASAVAVLAVASLGLVVVPGVLDDLRAPGVDAAAAPSYDEVPPFVPDAVQVLSQVAPAEESASVPEDGAARLSTGGTSPAPMLAAVRAALPAGVSLPDEGPAEQWIGRHRLVFSAERDGEPFTLRVWWQAGALNPHAFRPCTEPVAAFSRTAVWDDCTQAPTTSLDWRAVGSPDPHHRVIAIDDRAGSVTVVWETGTDRPDLAPGDVLSDDEAHRIAEAAWGVAQDSVMRYNGTGVAANIELRSDFGVGYIAESWANVETALTSVLGPLTRVRLDEAERSDWNSFDGSSPDLPQAVTASYRTADGGTVDLAIWNSLVIYGSLCSDLLACDVWPGSRDYFRPLVNRPAGIGGGTVFGDQGQAYLQLEGLSGDEVALHRAAMTAVFTALPDPT